MNRHRAVATLVPLGVLTALLVPTGPGADLIEARDGAGDDRLYGQGGHDVVRGDAGRDRAYGGTGRDTCSAERRVGCER